MESFVAVRPAENVQRLPLQRVIFTYYGYLRRVTLEVGSVSYLPLTLWITGVYGVFSTSGCVTVYFDVRSASG